MVSLRSHSSNVTKRQPVGTQIPCPSLCHHCAVLPGSIATYITVEWNGTGRNLRKGNNSHQCSVVNKETTLGISNSMFNEGNWLWEVVESQGEDAVT